MFAIQSVFRVIDVISFQIRNYIENTKRYCVPDWKSILLGLSDALGHAFMFEKDLKKQISWKACSCDI